MARTPVRKSWAPVLLAPQRGPLPYGPEPERWAFALELEREVHEARSKVPGCTDADVAEAIVRCREERDGLARRGMRPDCASPVVVVLMATVRDRGAK